MKTKMVEFYNFIRKFCNFPNGLDAVVSTVVETSSLRALFLGLAV